MECDAFIYTRSAHRAGRAAQEAACRTYAAQHELTVREVLNDSRSAADATRPVLLEVLRKAQVRQRTGVQVAILCTTPDRLLRSLATWATVQKVVARGVELHFASVQRRGAPEALAPKLTITPTRLSGPSSGTRHGHGDASAP